MKKSTFIYWIGFVAFFAGLMILNHETNSLLMFSMILLFVGFILVEAYTSYKISEEQLEELKDLNNKIENKIKELQLAQKTLKEERLSKEQRNEEKLFQSKRSETSN